MHDRSITDKLVRSGNGLAVSTLSPDQSKALDTIGAWIRSTRPQPILSMGGYAGTGKTTLLGLLGSIEDLQPIAFVSLTGKATSVLRSKLGQQANVSTIHSLIYKPIVESNVVEGWELKEELPDSYKLIVVDEASMVSDDMLVDLRSYGIPILAVGDHGQLPPVGGSGSLMSNPDIRLEQIHRQAEGNSIIGLSKAIRLTSKLDKQFASENVRFYRSKHLQELLQRRYSGECKIEDMVSIVFTNRKRIQINVASRGYRGMAGPPNVHEQVVCLQNIKNKPVYNGMRGEIVSLVCRDSRHPWKQHAEVQFEGGTKFAAKMCVPQFMQEKTFSSHIEAEDVLRKSARNVKLWGWPDVGDLFDFGYAMTCHKMQGSQCKDVLVVAEKPVMIGNDEWSRWAYTAVTRASERLSIIERD